MTSREISMLQEKKKEIGARFKTLVEAKESNHNRATIGEKLGYSETSISRFYSGVTALNDTAFKKIIDEFKVRKEYLLCEDDFKTDEEMYACLNENDMSEYKKSLHYLETLGLEFKPVTTLRCSLTSLYKHFTEVSPFIKFSSLQDLQKQYDFNLSNAEFVRRYFGTWCTVELSSSPYKNIPTLDKLTKTSGAPTGDCSLFGDTFLFSPHDASTSNLLNTNHEISIYFKVFYKGKYLHDIIVVSLQDFLKKLDEFSLLAINTLIVNSGNATFHSAPNSPTS